jgi:hypothetical protein
MLTLLNGLPVICLPIESDLLVPAGGGAFPVWTPPGSATYAPPHSGHDDPRDRGGGSCETAAALADD